MTTEAPARRRRSYSQLSVYQQCPEQFRHKYILRTPEEPSVWTVGGTAFHQVAEWYLDGALGTEPRDTVVTDAWKAAWKIAYDEVVERTPGINPDVRTWRAANRGKETATWWHANGLLMVQDFLAWKRTAGRDLQVFTDGDKKYLEARLEVELGEVPVVAIPDWLAVDEHGQLCIVDYKTGKPPRESKQLGVYRAAVIAALGLDVTWGLYYMARPAQLIPVDVRKYDPAAIGNEFAFLDEQVNEGVFTPTPGDHCKFCPFRKDGCRYYNPEVE